MILSCIFARRLPRGGEVAAAILTLIGVVLLATHGRLDGLVISVTRSPGAGLAALALTTYTLLPGDLLRKWGTPLVNGFAMLIGGVVMAGSFRIWEKSWTLICTIILALLAMVVLGTVIAFSFYLQAFPISDRSRPVCWPALSRWWLRSCRRSWLGTEFAPIDLCGFALIIGGCLLVSLSEGGDEKKQDTKEGNGGTYDRERESSHRH